MRALSVHPFVAFSCLASALVACGGDAPPANVPPDAVAPPDTVAPLDTAAPDADAAPAPDLAPDADAAPAPDLAPEADAPDDVAPDLAPPDATPDAASDVALDVGPDGPPPCPTGQERCDGVCRDVQVDPSHCGACGNACGAQPNAAVNCVAGRCERRCSTGFEDCDGTAANGCEADTRASASHCGACGRACAVANGAPECVAGACRVARCDDGFGDCNAMAADGCETDTRASVEHCGGCGRACALPNATSACAAGRCGVTTCASGFGDCDGTAANGCEVPLAGNNENCGACGRRCAAGEVCSTGACQLTCRAGTTLCGAACADLQTDVANCGTCGRACAVASGVASCSAGACGLAACLAGFGDCDGAAASGCEVDLRASARNCGACGRACAAGARCQAGACVTPRNTAEILMADPTAPSGTYTIDPDGAGPLPALPLYVDFTTDGGGWVLVWKSDMSNNNDRTDGGYNVAALATGAVDAVAVAPRGFIAAVGSTFRVVSGEGTRRFFWRGVPFYTTDAHGRPEGSVLAVETTVDITRPFRAGEATFYGTHALCVFDGLANVTPGHTFAEHFCGGRWCCGANAGAWWNYGRWNPGSYTPATAWAR